MLQDSNEWTGCAQVTAEASSRSGSEDRLANKAKQRNVRSVSVGQSLPRHLLPPPARRVLPPDQSSQRQPLPPTVSYRRRVLPQNVISFSLTDNSDNCETIVTASSRCHCCAHVHAIVSCDAAAGHWRVLSASRCAVSSPGGGRGARVA